MIIRPDQMKTETKINMRGGDGTVTIRHYDRKENMKHCRLMSHITIPVGAGIGQHEHLAETEYYLILSGTGIVTDNGRNEEVVSGCAVVTGDKQSHSITNTGDIPLEMIAVIITDAE